MARLPLRLGNLKFDDGYEYKPRPFRKNMEVTRYEFFMMVAERFRQRGYEKYHGKGRFYIARSEAEEEELTALPVTLPKVSKHFCPHAPNVGNEKKVVDSHYGHSTSLPPRIIHA